MEFVIAVHNTQLLGMNLGCKTRRHTAVFLHAPPLLDKLWRCFSPITHYSPTYFLFDLNLFLNSFYSSFGGGSASPRMCVQSKSCLIVAYYRSWRSRAGRLMQCIHRTFGLSHPHTTGMVNTKKWEDEGEGNVGEILIGARCALGGGRL